MTQNEGKEHTRGTLLTVPYQEKEQVKALGARWDKELKRWFVPSGQDTSPFSAWLPPDSKGNPQVGHH